MGYTIDVAIEIKVNGLVEEAIWPFHSLGICFAGLMYCKIRFFPATHKSCNSGRCRQLMHRACQNFSWYCNLISGCQEINNLVIEQKADEKLRGESAITLSIWSLGPVSLLIPSLHSPGHWFWSLRLLPRSSGSWDIDSLSSQNPANSDKWWKSERGKWHNSVNMAAGLGYSFAFILT